MENCIHCGCKLQETNWGRKNCPNCGMLDENNENQEVEDEPKGNYIG